MLVRTIEFILGEKREKMDRQELIKAMDEGKEIYWQSDNYKVYKDSIGQYLVTSRFNGFTTGIFHKVGDGMNIDPADCYLA